MLRSNKSQVLFPVVSGLFAGNGSKLEGSIFAAILSRFSHIGDTGHVGSWWQ